MAIVNIATVRETIENTVAEFNGACMAGPPAQKTSKLTNCSRNSTASTKKPTKTMNSACRSRKLTTESGWTLTRSRLRWKIFSDSFADNGPDNGYLNEVIYNRDADMIYEKNFEVVEDTYQELLANDWEFKTLSGAICDSVNWTVRDQSHFDCANLSESIVEALEALH